MVEWILDVLRNLGWIGLGLGVAIEALSIPFPAAIFVIVYGYLLNPSWLEIFSYSIITTMIYVVVSFVPYYISIRYEGFVKKKLPQQKLKFAQKWIDRYGDWMIAVGRFIGMGYITYIAGLSKMNKMKFALLTFIGFYPLSVLMFYLGTLGNLEIIVERFQQTQGVIFAGIVVAICCYVLFRLYRRKKYKESTDKSAHSSSHAAMK
ncbi:DedA family protein [Salipaludibacillus daqingensis]|uniref:DedA family protein n=1 Tax=Salipaludibacillus daqingensis TaxID=3041001 RepID=UPI0024741ABB|nr:VTT domain-containing protein [Salipaludibacillus daqingensis]